MHRLAGIIIALALAGCGADKDSGSGAPQKAAEPQPEFIQLRGENVWVMIIPANADPARIKPWAKDRCGEVEFCRVFGWTDRASAARAFPMTDAEVASQAVSYGVNRATGYESFAWDCKRFPKTDKVDCL